MNKFKELNIEWKDKVEEINDSNLNEDIKNKALLNLGCNYSLTVSKDSLVKQSKRVKNAISTLYSNIRIYTVNDTEASVQDDHKDKSSFYDFLRNMGLWIINDKTLSTITISFSRFIPSYNDENYKNDIVDIYCVR